jgi:hypothetical protein
MATKDGAGITLRWLLWSRFSVCDLAAAPRDALSLGVATLCHLLPAVAGYPGPVAATSRVVYWCQRRRVTAMLAS